MEVQHLTPKTFKKYGVIIEYPQKESKGIKRNLWKIIHKVTNKVGWRVAYLILRDRTLGRLECHPESDETFEPVKGKAVIFISSTKNLNDFQCFYLDKPIVLFKGVWHGLIRLEEEVEIKITENLNVSCEYWNFGFRYSRNNLDIK